MNAEVQAMAHPAATAVTANAIPTSWLFPPTLPAAADALAPPLVPAAAAALAVPVAPETVCDWLTPATKPVPVLPAMVVVAAALSVRLVVSM